LEKNPEKHFDIVLKAKPIESVQRFVEDKFPILAKIGGDKLMKRVRGMKDKVDNVSGLIQSKIWKDGKVSKKFLDEPEPDIPDEMIPVSKAKTKGKKGGNKGDEGDENPSSFLGSFFELQHKKAWIIGTAVGGALNSPTIGVTTYAISLQAEDKIRKNIVEGKRQDMMSNALTLTLEVMVRQSPLEERARIYKKKEREERERQEKEILEKNKSNNLDSVEEIEKKEKENGGATSVEVKMKNLLSDMKEKNPEKYKKFKEVMKRTEVETIENETTIAYAGTDKR